MKRWSGRQIAAALILLACVAVGYVIMSLCFGSWGLAAAVFLAAFGMAILVAAAVLGLPGEDEEDEEE